MFQNVIFISNYSLPKNNLFLRVLTTIIVNTYFSKFVDDDVKIAVLSRI